MWLATSASICWVFFVRKFQPLADLSCHANSQFHVTVKPDAIAGRGSRPKRSGLPDIVQQNAPGQGSRCAHWQACEHHARVSPDVSFGVKLGRLRYTFQGENFRQDLRQQAGFVEQLKPAASSAFGQQFGQLFMNPLGRNRMNLPGVLLDGRERARFNGVGNAGGKAHRPEHPELVFCESPARVADGADQTGFQVGLTTNKIEDFPGVMAHGQAIDRKVAASHVLLRGMGVNHLVRMAAVRIVEVPAKGGDFDLSAVSGDENDPEFCTNGDALGEKFCDPLGRGVGRNVVIGGLANREADRARSRLRGKLRGRSVAGCRKPNWRVPENSWLDYAPASRDRLLKMRAIRARRSYLISRTRQVMSSDWRVGPTKSSTLFIR